MLKNTLDMAEELLNAYLSDFTDADLMVRPVDGANHAAWQLGHLIASENQMLVEAGFNMPALPEGFMESYTKETSTSDDAAKFLTKDEYLALARGQRGGTRVVLEGLSPADLDRPTPESMHAYAKTVGELVNVVGLHVLMHVSQLVPLRRKLGKPILI